MIQKIAIYGAGAIGGWIGTRLALAGCELSAVARGATLRALQTHGLRLDQGGQSEAGAQTLASGEHRRETIRIDTPD